MIYPTRKAARPISVSIVPLSPEKNARPHFVPLSPFHSITPLATDDRTGRTEETRRETQHSKLGSKLSSLALLLGSSHFLCVRRPRCSFAIPRPLSSFLRLFAAQIRSQPTAHRHSDCAVEVAVSIFQLDFHHHSAAARHLVAAAEARIRKSFSAAGMRRRQRCRR